jgi:hypothetical protein
MSKTGLDTHRGSLIRKLQFADPFLSLCSRHPYGQATLTWRTQTGYRTQTTAQRVQAALAGMSCPLAPTCAAAPVMLLIICV